MDLNCRENVKHQHNQSFYIAEREKYNIVKPFHNATKSCLELHFIKTHHVTKGFLLTQMEVLLCMCQ